VFLYVFANFLICLKGSIDFGANKISGFRDVRVRYFSVCEGFLGTYLSIGMLVFGFNRVKFVVAELLGAMLLPASKESQAYYVIFVQFSFIHDNFCKNATI
jgi:hypothetical protein